MNILVWSTYVEPPVGGQERTSLELALQMHRRGHHVVLAGAFDHAPELRAKIPTAMPYYHWDMHRQRFKPHWAAAQLARRLIRKHQIQVVSAHGSILALHEVCRRKSVPLVWTIHGASPRATNFINRLKTIAVRHVVKDPLCHVVGVSRATAEIVGREFPEIEASRLHFIHTGGMDDVQLLALPLPKPGPPWRLGFVSRVVSQKRPLDLVTIARSLAGGLDFQIHVFGDGPLLPVLRAEVKTTGLDAHFVLHGYWDKGRASMIEQFQILVHPAGEEPLGLALIEAQLGGRPVAAYQLGGIPEIVVNGETGVLAPPGDPAALAAGIRQLASGTFTQVSAAARARASMHFTLARMTADYESLFQKLCASL